MMVFMPLTTTSFGLVSVVVMCWSSKHDSCSDWVSLCMFVCMWNCFFFFLKGVCGFTQQSARDFWKVIFVCS